MESSRMFVSCLLILTLSSLAFGLDKFQQRCTEASNTTTEISPGNKQTIITVDSCDNSKYLACRGGRCACSDAVNHIYTFREFKVKDRNRRSPGKGKGKGISTGKAVVGGAVVGVAGYEIGKAVANSQNNGGSGGGGSSNSGGHKREKKEQVYSCYARAQGDCVIDRKRVTFIENSTTSIVGNSTTTIVAKHAIDYSGYPLCIDHAECNAKRTYVSGQDTNIGECVCKDGYRRTSTDICVSAGGLRFAGFGASMFFGIFVALFVAQAQQ